MKYYIYKYVANEKIVYIGKTNDIVRRIKEHSSGVGLEAKFTQYSDAEIWYHECGNETEMSALESLLINYYKPELNEIDVEEGEPTVTFNIQWELYSEFSHIHQSDIEQDYRNCLKQIKANNTRISAYQKEYQDIANALNKWRKFYMYLDRNKEFITHYYNESLGMDESIFIDKPVYIGNKTVKKWYQSVDSAGDVLWIKFSGEFLQAFFGAVCHKDWMEDALHEIGGYRLEEINERIEGLYYKNKLLEDSAEALRKELYGRLS